MVMMKIFKTMFIVLSLAVLFVLSGCTGTNQTSKEQGSTNKQTGEKTSSDSQANEPKQLVKWVHGVIKPQIDSAFVYMAREKEFFKKYGIDIEYKEFVSAPLMSQALISGAIDSAESNPMGAIFANLKGGDLKIIGTTMPGLDLAVYAKKDLKTIKDLQGEKIGTSAPGDLPDQLMRAIFQKEGLNPNGATYAAVGGKADRLKALKAGVIDADVNSLEILPEVEADPNLHLIAAAEDIVPQFPRLTIMVSESKIKSKPDKAIVGFLAAQMEGLQYALDHADEAKALAAKTMGINKDNSKITSYYDLAVKRKWADPKMEFDQSRITWLQDFLKSVGVLKEKVPNDKLFDMSYRDKAYKLVFEK